MDLSLACKFKFLLHIMALLQRERERERNKNYTDSNERNQNTEAQKEYSESEPWLSLLLKRLVELGRLSQVKAFVRVFSTSGTNVFVTCDTCFLLNTPHK